MKDWIGYIRNSLSSDIWGFILLDYYYHQEDLEYKRSPSVFLNEFLAKLKDDLIEPIEFHRVFINVCVQLLGNDFVEIASKSVAVIQQWKIKSKPQIDAIAKHYDVYGRNDIFWQCANAAGISEESVSMDDRNGEQSKSVQTVLKTVVELDLIGYSTIARMLEQNMGPETVMDLNTQIQGFIDKALGKVKLVRKSTVFSTGGDSAILLFENGNVAHSFIEHVHEITKDHNSNRTEKTAERWFRAGASTGEIAIQNLEGKIAIAGIAIANAVRLETASGAGELLVDMPTFETMSPTVQARYLAEEVVRGKREEFFSARRCTFVSGIATQQNRRTTTTAATQTGSRRNILELIGNLYPESQLETLMFLIEMPIRDQPSRLLNLGDKVSQTVRWAESPAGCTLSTLEDELIYLLERSALRVAAQH